MLILSLSYHITTVHRLFQLTRISVFRKPQNPRNAMTTWKLLKLKKHHCSMGLKKNMLKLLYRGHEHYRPIKLWQTLIRCSFCLLLILLLLSLDCFNLRKFLFSLSLKIRVMPWLRVGCWSCRVWKERKIVLKLLYRGHKHYRIIEKCF